MKDIFDENDVVRVTYFMKEQYHISYQMMYHRHCYEKKYNEEY